MQKAIVKLWTAATCALLLMAAQPSFAGDAPLQMITPAEFTPVEAKFYQTLDPAAQQDFIATRSYVRISQQVIDRTLPPLQLPDRPAGFSVKYLLPGEPFDLNTALADYITATHGGKGNLVPEMTDAQILQPSDLNPAELSFFQTLDTTEARHFIVTRSYVRLCQQVLDQKLPAYQLPDAPPGIRGAYLLAGEEGLISKAVDLSLQDLLRRYPDAANHLLQ